MLEELEEKSPITRVVPAKPIIAKIARAKILPNPLPSPKKLHYPKSFRSEVPCKEAWPKSAEFYMAWVHCYETYGGLSMDDVAKYAKAVYRALPVEEARNISIVFSKNSVSGAVNRLKDRGTLTSPLTFIFQHLEAFFEQWEATIQRKIKEGTLSTDTPAHIPAKVIEDLKAKYAAAREARSVQNGADKNGIADDEGRDGGASR